MRQGFTDMMLITAAVTGQLAGGCLETWDGGGLRPEAWVDVDPDRLWPVYVEGALTRLQDAVGEDCQVPFWVDTAGHPVRLYPPERWPYGEEYAGKFTGEEVAVVGTGPEGKWHLIIHELGHALGLGHSSTPGDLMYRVAGSHFSEETVSRLRSAMGCP